MFHVSVMLDILRSRSRRSASPPFLRISLQSPNPSHRPHLHTMDGTAAVASGVGDDGSCSDPAGVGSRSSTPRPTANPKYVCLRSLVGAASSSSNASREAMPPIARKVLDAGARLWVPVASDGSGGSDTDGSAGSASSPASTLRKPLLRGPRRHGLHGDCRDAELQIQAGDYPLQLHPVDYDSHLQVLLHPSAMARLIYLLHP
jgi:hypothetical protein